MLQINPEFKKLIPALTVDEFQQLEANCLAEGIRDAIVVWNGYILDGHNRYEIANKHRLQYRTVEKHFESETDAKIWMIYNQFGRRNLNAWQRSVLALELEDVFKEKAKENLILSGKLFGELHNKANIIESDMQEGWQKSANPLGKQLPKIEPMETRKELAKFANVSHDTISKVKVIESKATPEVKAQLSAGDMSINQAYKEIKQEEKLQTFLDNTNKFKKPIDCKNFEQEIILGDCLDVLPTLGKREYNLLLTDMPYGMDFKSGWSDKGKIANDTIDDTVKLLDETLLRVKPLLTVDAHFYIFGSINYITHIRPIIEKYLTLKNILIWDRGVIGMGDLSTYGSSYDIVYFGYNKLWRKLNGVRDRDILSFNRIAPHKAVHPTEKPIELIEYLVRKSTNERDKVLDPFAGGGSTLVACKNINRFATGIELKEEYVNLIKTKI